MRHVLKALLVTGLLALIGCDAIDLGNDAALRAGDPLFEAANAGRQDLQAQGLERLRTLERVQTTALIRLVRVHSQLSQQPAVAILLDAKEGLVPDAPVVYRNEDAELDAFNGSGQVELLIRRDEVEVLSDDTYAWRGTVLVSPTRIIITDDNEVGSATFIYGRDGHVTGSIRIEDEYYKVRPLEDGLNALMQVDESKAPRGGSSPLY